MRRWLTVSVLAMLVVACDDATIVEPDVSLHRQGRHDRSIVVMSRNLYLGADIDALLDPAADLGTALGVALGQVQRTDFPARAKAFAQEIHDVHPDLVGLQEVTTYLVTLEDGTIVPAFGFPLDFLDVLRGELASLGDTYVVAQRTPNVSLTFPLAAVDPAYLGLYVTYSDADAIIVREGIHTWNPTGGQFPTQQYLSVAGTTIENKRGYATVDARVNGIALRFASAHLEIQLFKDVQQQQARELAAILDKSPLPVILVGDFNSAANYDAPAESKTRSYRILRHAGFEDLWRLDRHRGSGLTCCQAGDLSNTTSLLNQRLDIVFVRWSRRWWDGFDGESRVDLVGDKTADIFTHPATDLIPVEYTLWPSDHAGIAAWLWPHEGRIASRRTEYDGHGDR